MEAVATVKGPTPVLSRLTPQAVNHVLVHGVSAGVSLPAAMKEGQMGNLLAAVGVSKEELHWQMVYLVRLEEGRDPVVLRELHEGLVWQGMLWLPSACQWMDNATWVLGLKKALDLPLGHTLAARHSPRLHPVFDGNVADSLAVLLQGLQQEAFRLDLESTLPKSGVIHPPSRL